ncbi:MAG: hypothetical protein CMP95_02695 [Gammaproteobacteria bacterium]|nr:hypothetical protein [Gammaproteobacteria bacterium]|tara:strand:+ start:2890 stop:3237 length:348 start_codon:yes stop_codon:yes gene_type:complete
MAFWKRKGSSRANTAAKQEERARQIFEFETEEGTRYCDPMMVALALSFDAEFKPEHLERAKNGNPQSMEVVAAAGARAFKLDRLDPATGKGQTVAQLIGLVDAFDLWCFQLQKKT